MGGRARVDAFDADVLIYAADPGHPLGERVAALFPAAPVAGPGPTPRVGVGSVLLVPEVLSKPLRDGDAKTVRKLSELLARLDLRPVDRATAEQAAILRARYNLRTADATHLATAISMGAHRFITNNTRDFSESIKEIDITYPADLPHVKS
jgi:predicted nucleic acid-binding protein